MKVYVVNGAAHEGFGEATTRTLIEEGCKVIGLYEKEDEKNVVKLKQEFSDSQFECICIDLFDFNKLKSNLVHRRD